MTIRNKPRTLSILVIALLSLALLGGCSQRETGNVVGGIAGAALGNQFGHGSGRVAMTALGAIAGSAIGGAIGQNMDDTDRLKTQRALERARTDETSSWTNPDTGHRYQVTPTRTYNQGGRACREYTTRAYIDGRKEVIRGTACRQADGSWVAS
ncbi:MAG: RT0821/Lpp0805 family surface protein [Gammaproteobacteria bacterium SHHR-1]|uniref:RT0821/Lpp0805 family surface protein n=1 Tax=Magnetovirga frankeli TaxID=947516 RepID=UPI001293A3AA|nr:glycine zipper 2TM domain-containing protein [gamma proteobacterium SS-5]